MRGSLLAMVWSGVSVCGVAAVAEDAHPPTAEVRPAIPAQQPADEPVLKLNPVRGRSDADQKRMDALAHFMAGELYLERGDADLATKALRELEQAIELNPNAIEPYRLYIPAAVRQGEEDNARKYALKATEHTPEGVQLLRALVAVYVQQGQVENAIAVLTASQELKSLPEKSFARLVLDRHLGQCYALQQKSDEAAAVYRKLFDALRPEPENLTADERKQLFGEKGELYEDMGNAFLAAKLPELAVEAFGVSAQKHGRSGGLHSFNLAQVFHQTGKPERALEELEKYFAAQHVEKGRAPYQLFKELLTELKREGEFFPRLQELAAKDKHNKFLHHYLAGELVAQGKLDEAEAIYNAMGGQADPEALLGLASIYRRQGKPAEWVKTAGRAFAVLQLNNSQVRNRLSPEYQEMGDRFEADLEDLAQNAEQTESILKYGRDQASGDDPKLEFDEAWLLGRLAVDAKKADDVARFYKYAIGMQNLPSYDLFRELGAYYIDAEQYADAERTFLEAANHPALEPLRFFFLSLVSVAREMDGRIDEALAAIQETRKLQPGESQFAVQEARIYYRARRWDDAVDTFESIIREFREDAELVRDCQFSLSAILVQKGDFDRGEQILLDILAKEPDHPQANNDLGYLWADRDKNLEQARDMITKALAAEPENAAYMDSMGWVLYRLGEYAEAAKQLEKASSTPRGEDATIFEHLGDCRAKLGEQDKALAAWKKALELEEAKSSPDPKLLESLKRKLPTQP
jgi:tetratricopeptide (TPR) repeat protein